MILKNKLIKLSVFLAWLVGTGSNALAAPSGWSISNYIGTNLPGTTGSPSIYNIISNILLWALGIFGFIAIIGFVISGIMYLTSAGDDTAMKRAKNQMTWSIIGVIVGLVGYIAVYSINAMLNSGSSYNTTF